MQANSSLAVFWTMARILSNPDVHLKVQAEISDALASSGGVFSLDMLQRVRYLRYCIKVSFQQLPAIVSFHFLLNHPLPRPTQESLRLHANGIQLRRVVKDVEIGGYSVPAGHFLSFHCLRHIPSHWKFAGHDIIVCPVVVQNDTKVWPAASKFNPSRFFDRETASAQASTLPDPNDLSRFDFLPFGLGRYSCPGNVFAMNEMLLFLSMMFHTFAMRLVNPIPSPDLTKMVGAACWIRPFSKR